MKFSEWSEKNAPSIAIVVSVVALGFACAPQVEKLWNECFPEVVFCEGNPCPPPRTAPRGPGSGGFRAAMAVSESYREKLAERVAILEKRIASGEEDEIDALRLECDLAKLALIRAESGFGRMVNGASEALLRERVAAMRAAKKDSLKLRDELNRAELDLIAACDRLRAKDIFLAKSRKLENYPVQPASSADLAELVNAETGAPEPYLKTNPVQ